MSTKLFDMYEQNAKLYQGNAETIEDLYKECIATTTWSWREVKAFRAKRPNKTGRERRVVAKEKTIVDRYKLSQGAKVPAKQHTEIIDVTEELAPNRLYESVIFSKLFIQFRSYIIAMVNRYRHSLLEEEVVHEAEDAVLNSLDCYIPGRCSKYFGQQGNQVFVTSFKQTFNIHFNNLLMNKYNFKMRSKRSGRTNTEKAIVLNSLEAHLESGSTALPSYNLNSDLVINLQQTIDIILEQITNTRDKEAIQDIINDILKSGKVKKGKRLDKLKALIIEHRDMFYEVDCIPQSV